MAPKFEIASLGSSTITMLWFENDDGRVDDDKINIHVHFQHSFEVSDSDDHDLPFPAETVRELYPQSRIFLTLHGIKECIIRNSLVSTMEKITGDIEYDLEAQRTIDDFVPKVCASVSEYLRDPSNLNAKGLSLYLNIVRKDCFNESETTSCLLDQSDDYLLV